MSPDSSLPDVAIKYTGDSTRNGLMTHLKCNSQLFTAFFDSGATVNLIKMEVYRRLCANSPEDIKVVPSDTNLQGISGRRILPYGKVMLSFSLDSNAPSIRDYFYIVSEAVFNTDVLIGFRTMSKYDISLFPGSNQIAQQDTYIHAIRALDFAYPHDSILSVSRVDNSHDITTSVRDESDSSETASSSPVSQDVNFTSCKNILSATQLELAEHERYVINVNIDSVTQGTDVLCCAQQSPCKSLQLESVLTRVDASGKCMIAVTNVSPHPVKLREGMLLGVADVYSAPLKELEDAQCLSFSSDTSNLQIPPITDYHIPSVDFPESKEKLLSLLNDFRSTVSLSGEPLGRTSAVTHSIHLTPGSTPSYIPSYRIPHSRRVILERSVEELLKEGVIQPANSPHNSPLLIVPKKDGDWRVVVDFRTLNSNTVPDRYPMPRLGDLLQSLGNSKSVFSTVDLQSGYFQVELDEASRPYTAFTTQTGQFMFVRMAQGLRNSPLTFMRLMNTVLSGLIGKDVFCFLDDVIIASNSISEHLHTLSLVLSRFEEAGLKIKLSKCAFLKSEVKFLGHKVDKRGIQTLDDKVAAVKQFPVPTNADQIRSFLGLAGFYRQFIKDFSQIARPLTQLLKKNAKFQWTDDEQLAFDALKSALCSAPILAIPDFTKDFILCTDASGYGCGAVLMQKDPSGKHRVIAYASKLLNKAQQNFDVTNRESYAIIWALRHFRELILGYNVHVFTDHYACTEIFKGDNLTGKFARWQLTIQEFNPRFSYLPGKMNVVADSLSRNVAPVSVVVDDSTLPTTEEIKEKQRSDEFCNQIMYYLESGDESHLPKLQFKPESFFVQDDVLYKSSDVIIDDSNVKLNQMVIPKSLVDVILFHVHDSPLAGHPGRDRCIAQAKRQYFWPSMRKDIMHHCSMCEKCAAHKVTPGHEGKALPYPIATGPWQEVSIDLMKLPVTQNGHQYLLVCVDSFSRFTVLVALKDKSAKSVGKAFLDHVILPHTSPRVLLSDNGSEFNNAVLNEICKEFNIKKCNIVPHSPSSNGKVERCNKRILDVLRYITEAKHSWDDWIPVIACSINSSLHSTIKEAPYFVLYGEDKRLPYQFLHDSPRPLYNFDDYVKCRLRDFQSIHKVIHERLTASQSEMLEKQHNRASDFTVAVGDIVFNKVHDRHSKLDPIFEGPYRVTESLHGHKVKLLDLKSSDTKIVHVDHLKRVNKGFDCEIEERVELHSPSGSSATHPRLADTSPSSYRSKLRSFTRDNIG